MRKTISILIFVLILSSLLVSATTLGTFKINENINLKQTCADCTYINITSILFPNSSEFLTNEINMTKNGVEFNYTFSGADVVGQYIVSGYGDPNGIKTVWTYDFYVTLTGEESSSFGFSISITIIAFLSILIIFSIIMIFYLDGIAKTIPLLFTSLFITYGFNILTNLAESANISSTITRLLWLGYRINVYGFWILFLFVLFSTFIF